MFSYVVGMGVWHVHISLSFTVQIAMEDSVVGQGKENLLIPEQTQVLAT